MLTAENARSLKQKGSTIEEEAWQVFEGLLDELDEAIREAALMSDYASILVGARSWEWTRKLLEARLAKDGYTFSFERANKNQLVLSVRW